MCVRSSVTPKEKKQMATNKLWGGSKPELLEETNGMDVADEIVFLNREVRRLSSVCSEYRKEIDKYEDMFSNSRSFLYDLRAIAIGSNLLPTDQAIVEMIDKRLNIGE